MGNAALAAAVLYPCKVTRISCKRQRNTKTKLKKIASLKKKKKSLQKNFTLSREREGRPCLCKRFRSKLIDSVGAVTRASML